MLSNLYIYAGAFRENARSGTTNIFEALQKTRQN